METLQTASFILHFITLVFETVPISIPFAHNPESTFNSELVPANVGVLFYVFVVGMCVVASYFRSLICPLHLQLHLNERLSGSCRQMNESSLTDDRPCVRLSLVLTFEVLHPEVLLCVLCVYPVSHSFVS